MVEFPLGRFLRGAGGFFFDLGETRGRNRGQCQVMASRKLNLDGRVVESTHQRDGNWLGVCGCNLDTIMH